MAVEKALNPMPSGDMEYTDDIVTEIVVETDGNTGETTIGIAEMPESEALVPHDANIAEILDEQDLVEMAMALVDTYHQDRQSRSEWEETLVEGMDLLGVKLEEVTEPFEGACGASHPLLIEACLQFQARTIGELCPPDGPVKTKIIGEQTEELLRQAQRVQRHMNSQLTEECEEYFDDMDRLLFALPLNGIGFKKTYYDQSMGRGTSRYVKAQDFVVDNEATDLLTSPRYTHVLHMAENDIRKNIYAGVYRDVELGKPSRLDRGVLTEKENEITGISYYTADNDRHRVLEMHVDLNIQGFEHLDMESGEPTGIALPYIVTIHEDSNQILSIRRNYAEGDTLYRKLSWFTTYKFLPGLGFYGLGFIHVLGNLQKTATPILRALDDAGQYANLPGGFKARGMRLAGDQPVSFGEFRSVEGVGDDIRKSIIPLPTKEPSQTLLMLLGTITDNGRRLAASTDIQVGDANSKDSPVGSVVALMEAGQRLMSAIHRRLYRAQKAELRIFARLNAEFNDFTGYNNGSGEIRAEDYDATIDIIPVADPSIISESQRIMRAQAQLQVATQFPQQHDVHAALRSMHVTLGTEDIDDVLLPDRGPERADPATENFSFLHGKPAKAFADQDHQAHMTVHQTFLLSMQKDQATFSRLAPLVNAHIAEHMAHTYRQQIEAAMQQRLPTAPDYNPLKPTEQGEYAELAPEIENEVAKMQAMAAQQLAQQAAALQQAQQNAAMAQDPNFQLALQKLAIDKQEADTKSFKAQADVALKQAEIQAEIQDENLDRELAAEKAVLDAQIKASDQRARVQAAALNVSNRR